MLTNNQIEILLEIKRKPKNINIDSKVSISTMNYLLKNDYISKSKSFRSTDGNIMFDYMVTEKGIEALENNFEL